LKRRRVFGTRRLFFLAATASVRRKDKMAALRKMGKIKTRKEGDETEIFSEIVVETNAEIC
jgi:hypothetical protein